VPQLKIQIPEKLEPLLEPKKFKVIYGGRGSGKSMTVADLLLMRIMSEGIKVACMREMMNSIDDSVHALLCSEIERLGLDGFTIQANAIYHKNGGEVKYKGVARNSESVKSMHGFDVFWIEEAAALSKRSIDVLIPTLRKEGSEIWFTFNPGSSADPISLEFLKPFEHELQKSGTYNDDMHTIIKCNYTDNPFFPLNLNSIRLSHKKTKSRAFYGHTWLAEYNDHVENSIIATEWFDAAIDAHKLDRLKAAFKPHGARVVGFDPMDGGNDAHGYAQRHGSIIERVLCKDDGEIDVGMDWATNLALGNDADWFVWDGDGIGSGAKRQASDSFKGTRCKFHLFKGSLSGSGQDRAGDTYIPVEGDKEQSKPATYADTFKNNRAQYYIRLSELFYNTYRCVVRGEYVDPADMISLDSEGIDEIERLRSEVCRIPLKQNNTSLKQIMSKIDMLKLGIVSPNMSDAIMMCIWGPKIEDDWAEIPHVKRHIV